MAVLIELNNIHKTYHIGDQRQHVLRGVNLKINQGDLVSIMGQSGSGKSTLMNIMGLLDQPTLGHYFFAGEDVTSLNNDQLAEIRNRKVGFVFQSFFLLPRMSALQNVGLPLIYRGLKEEEIEAKSMEMLRKVGMADWSKHKPNELSGGQQQRVAIARALVGEPDLILADEPTGALDPRIGSDVLKLFIDLNKESLTTLVIITHDPKVAGFCRRQLKMEKGHIEELEVSALDE